MANSRTQFSDRIAKATSEATKDTWIRTYEMGIVRFFLGKAQMDSFKHGANGKPDEEKLKKAPDEAI